MWLNKVNLTEWGFFWLMVTPEPISSWAELPAEEPCQGRSDIFVYCEIKV